MPIDTKKVEKEIPWESSEGQQSRVCRGNGYEVIMTGDEPRPYPARTTRPTARRETPPRRVVDRRETASIVVTAFGNVCVVVTSQ